MDYIQRKVAGLFQLHRELILQYRQSKTDIPIDPGQAYNIHINSTIELELLKIAAKMLIVIELENVRNTIWEKES